jgi:hypothetical protein
MTSTAASEGAGEQRRGLLPPDGVAWPPEPAATPPPREPADDRVLATPEPRPAGSDLPDWRTLPTQAPEGYRGSVTAPPVPAPRTEPWSIAALAAAVVGVVVYLWPRSGDLLAMVSPSLAIAFGLAGRRACSLDPTLRGRWLATAAVSAGGVLVAAVAIRLGG